MPTGPRGEKRPANVIGTAVTVGRISIGEIQENLKTPFGRKRSGYAGAAARADALTAERRQEIAKMAARRRWDD